MSKDFHGLLLVDKPSGITSHDVVAKVRRLMGTRSVGHSGTLDPLASGLMVCLINEGTKLSQYILEGDKAYRVRAQLGLRTDTLDITGHILEKNEVQVTLEQMAKAAANLVGEFNWPVPIYSAIKVQGKKLYDYAREDKDVQIPMKLMKFYDVKMVDAGADWAEFDISCSKGSYIRSWVDHWGNALGCGATMSGLRRTNSQPYGVDKALTFEQIERALSAGNGPSTGAFVDMEGALPGCKRIRVRGQDEVLLGNGQISHPLRSQLITLYRPGEDQAIQIFSQDSRKLLALVGLEPEKGFVIRRVFHYKNNE